MTIRIRALDRAPVAVCLLALSLFALSGCVGPRPTQQYESAAVNLGLLKRDYIVHRAEVAAAIAAEVNAAEQYVVARAPQVAKPALALDIDETSLDNWTLMVANDFGYITNGGCDYLPKGPCSSPKWEELGLAPAFPATLHLFNTAKSLGVKVFFITARSENERAWTENGLKKAGYANWDGLVLRNVGGASGPYKTAARAAIEAQGYTIIANSAIRRAIWRTATPSARSNSTTRTTSSSSELVESSCRFA